MTIVLLAKSVAVGLLTWMGDSGCVQPLSSSVIRSLTISWDVVNSAESLASALLGLGMGLGLETTTLGAAGVMPTCGVGALQCAWGTLGGWALPAVPKDFHFPFFFLFSSHGYDCKGV